MAMPRNWTPVLRLTPGPVRWKFCFAERSRIVSVYQLAFSRWTRSALGRSVSVVEGFAVTVAVSCGGGTILRFGGSAAWALGSAIEAKIRAASRRRMGSPLVCASGLEDRSHREFDPG